MTHYQKNKKICTKCNYIWESIVEIPKQCPRCKRYDWNKSMGGIECNIK